MKLSFLKSPAVILLTAVAIAVILVVTRPEPPVAVPEQKALLVNVLEVAKQDLRIDVTAQGVVRPRTRTELVAEVSGKVISMSSDYVVGGFFRQGDVLFKIDDTNYMALLSQAKAGLAQAEAALAQEKGRSWVAQTEWDQRQHPDSVTVEAKALALRKPQLSEAQARLEAARADLIRAEHDLQETIIRAPYDGMVSAKHVDVGQYVRSGASMGELFAVDVAEVRIPIPESKLAYLMLPGARQQYGQHNPEVTLTYYLGEQVYHWQGELVRTEGVMDDKSRVLYGVARVADPYGLEDETGEKALLPLRMGTFVSASVEGRVFQGLIELPRDILRPGNKLWIVDRDNRLQEREVKTLRTDGEKMFVYEGLEERDLVSLTSLGPVLPGTVVQITSSTSQLNATDLGHSQEAVPVTGDKALPGNSVMAPL
jgi:RND family efflux transporter MFP subunit